MGWFRTYRETSGRPVYTHGPFVRSLLIAYVILAIAVTVGLYGGYRVDQRNERALNAACALTLDLERRNAVTQGLLEQDETLGLSIDPEILRNTLRNQRQTVKALRGQLKDACPPYIQPEE